MQAVPRVASHRYEVGVVLQDLPPAEALNQCFDNLQQLNGVINDVFARLSARIKDERAKVAGVCARVATAEAKVKRVSQNQNKVTTLFSAAKYPAPKVLPEFARAFDELESHALATAAGTRTDYLVPGKARREPPAAVDTTQLFTELSHTAAQRREKEFLESEAAEGLGRLPANLPSTSSVLLFNSDQNPYKKYMSLDNLEGTGGQDRDKQERALASAPISLIEGVELPTFVGFTIDYKPNLGDVPTFNMPQNLPLGRLADINFGVPSNGAGSIAPSVAPITSLPSIDGIGLPAPPKTVAPATTAAGTGAPTAASAGGIPAAPAAPGAPGGAPMAPAAPGSTTGAATVLGMPPNAPAPPMAPMAPGAPDAPMAPAPPMAPPPPMAPAPPTSIPGASSTPEPGAPAPGGGGGGEGEGRNALLDAIRNSSIKSLKSAANRVVADKKKEKSGKAGGKAKSDAGSSGGPGDLMSALRARLTQRHKAMSGKQDDVKASAGGAAGAGGDDDGKRRQSMVLPRLGAGGKKGGGDDDDNVSEAGSDVGDLKASLKAMKSSNATRKGAAAIPEGDEEDGRGAARAKPTLANAKKPESKAAAPAGKAAPPGSQRSKIKDDDDADDAGTPAGPSLFKKVMQSKAQEVTRAAASKSMARKPSDADDGWAE